MAKFYGTVGYVTSIETKPGVWKDENVVEHEYSGETLQETGQNESAGKVVDDIKLVERISILGDPYAFQHYFSMKYVVRDGVKWKINSVSINYPRLILSIGGLYNDGD